MNNTEKLATQGTQDGRKAKQKHNTICVGRHYVQANTNNVNKTCALLQTTGGKNRTSFLCGNRNGDHWIIKMSVEIKCTSQISFY